MKEFLKGLLKNMVFWYSIFMLLIFSVLYLVGVPNNLVRGSMIPSCGVFVLGSIIYEICGVIWGNKK